MTVFLSVFISEKIHFPSRIDNMKLYRRITPSNFSDSLIAPQGPGDLQCIIGRQTRTGEESDELVTSYTYESSRCDSLLGAFVCRSGKGEIKISNV